MGRNLEIFFQKNPHLQSFETRPHILLDNSDTFLNLKNELNLLTIFFKAAYDNMKDLNELCVLLNKLHSNNKKLKFGIISNSYKAKINQSNIDQIQTLRALEKLEMKFEENFPVLPKIFSLKRVTILNYPSLSNDSLENIAASFPNLQRVDLGSTTENRILIFLRRLPRLKVLRMPRACWIGSIEIEQGT